MSSLHRLGWVSVLIGLLALIGCASWGGGGEDLLSDDRLGGDLTAARVTDNAFGLPAAVLDTQGRRDFEVGDSFFTQPWVTAPASTEARDGLGPQFNANSCAACHVRDGRGTPTVGVDGPGLLLRLSVPGTDEHGGPLPHPVYGGQLTDRAVDGRDPEGVPQITYETITGTYGDGSVYELREPSYSVTEWALGDPGEDLLIGPRLAPQMTGMGLLEAIDAEAVMAAADPDDEDADGISGRANMVYSNAEERTMLGRFGWKANVATVLDQTAGAFAGDIGITSLLNPITEDCAENPELCEDVSGGDPEISQSRLDHVVFYSQTLAVPPQRDIEDSTVRAGADAFLEMNCVACHTPSWTTGDHDLEFLSGQQIRPYTDLLVHDMGPGLADGRPDYLANGREWRTAPLWGNGLIRAVNGAVFYLHDGRARSVEEAILWHGGEAAQAQAAFVDADAETRNALVRFVESL